MSDRDAIIRRGLAAGRLLNDELATAATLAVIEDLTGEWLRTRPDDVTTREGCYRMIHAVHRIVAKLQAWQQNGLVEESRVEQARHDAADTPVSRSVYH